MVVAGAELRGAARAQLEVLCAAGLEPAAPERAAEAIAGAGLTVDALVGYSLRGAPTGVTAELIEQINASGNHPVRGDHKNYPFFSSLLDCIQKYPSPPLARGVKGEGEFEVVGRPCIIVFLVKLKG